MAISLPLPFRVAAGILGTGIDLVRSLPEDLPALPVTLVGNAMKLSIKVQQEIATLATRGDELLVGVTGGPEENPAWAKFDDDEPAQPVRPVRPVRGLKTPAAEPASGAKKAGAATTTTDTETVADPVISTVPDAVPAGEPGKPGPKTHADEPTPTLTAAAADVDLPAEGVDDPPALTTPEASSIPPTSTTAMDAAIDVAEAVIEEALIAVPDDAAAGEIEAEIEAEILTEALEDAVAMEIAAEVTEAVEDAVALELAAEVTEALEDAVALELALEVTEALEEANSAEETADDPENFDSPVIFEETAELTEALPIPLEIVEEVLEAADTASIEDADIEEAGGDGPEALPDYDEMTLAQVRGHLRELSSDEVSALLKYEQDGDARPPFLTLLSNRLVTLDPSNQ